MDTRRQWTTVALWVLVIFGSVNAATVRRSAPVVYSDTSVESDVIYQNKVVCFISASNQNYNYDSLGPGLCTHFILIDLIGVNSDGKLLLMQRTSRALTLFLEFKERLQQAGDPARFILAVGGVNQRCTQFSRAVNGTDQVYVLVDNVVTFANKHGLDGIDIAWFYPGQFGGRFVDRANLVLLLQQLSLRMQACGMTLSMTVGVDPRDIEISYDVPKIDLYVDFVNLLTGDYHDPKKPSHVSPLYPSDSDDRLNIDYSVRAYIRAGLNPQKIVVLTSTYAYLYTLKLCVNGGPASVKSVQKLSKLSAQEIIERENFYTSWDDARMVPYATLTHGLNKKWITFNDIESHRRKAEYVLKTQLGGIGAFTIDQDDYDGFASGIPYPFLWALVNIVRPELVYEDCPLLIDDDVPVQYLPNAPCNTCGGNRDTFNQYFQQNTCPQQIRFEQSPDEDVSYRNAGGACSACLASAVTAPPITTTTTTTVS